MKQFTLKFTEENLKRHLAYNPDVIVTTRDSRKADLGDVCVIEDRVFVVSDIMSGRIDTILECANPNIPKESGFTDYISYCREIEKIYGNLEKKLYVYTLRSLEKSIPPTLSSRVDDVENTVRYLQNLLHDHLQDPNGHGVKGDTIIYSTNE